jgi:hypothetical protein
VSTFILSATDVFRKSAQTPAALKICCSSRQASSGTAFSQGSSVSTSLSLLAARKKKHFIE